MLQFELKEAIRKIDLAVEKHADRVLLSAHRLEQVNRILKWYDDRWDELEPRRYAWSHLDLDKK